MGPLGVEGDDGRTTCGIAARSRGTALLQATLADPETPGYAAIRAVIALEDGDVRRMGRLTAMGRPFVIDARKKLAACGARALLDEPPSPQERLLEIGTRYVRTGSSRFAMRQVEAEAAMPHRTVYNTYKKPALIEACRRRAQTIWRARFARRVVEIEPDPRRRPVTAIDLILAWVGSPEFAGDQALRIRPASFGAERRDDDLREHLDALVRFGTKLADEAELFLPEQYGAYIATTIEGASVWFDRRSAAYAASLSFVEMLLAKSASI